VTSSEEITAIVSRATGDNPKARLDFVDHPAINVAVSLTLPKREKKSPAVASGAPLSAT
jgi:hypothetical protein